MVFASGFNMLILLILGLALFLAFFLLILFLPSKFGYILLRIQTFINPNTGDNFQSQKALDAIKQGGLTGQGMGEGILKDRVPEAHTDYIIAVIAEEFGSLGCFVLIVFFSYLIFFSYKRIKNEKNFFIILAVSGLIIQLSSQIFINIASTIGLIPTTGTTLPFISYGGSSMISMSLNIGVILALTRVSYKDIIISNEKKI